MAHRAGALSRGPPGPAHAPVGDEGLGLRLAWTTLGLGRRNGRGRQSVLARAPPELQDHRSEEHTSELQSQSKLVCRLLLEKKKQSHQPRLSLSLCRLLLITI